VPHKAMPTGQVTAPVVEPPSPVVEPPSPVDAPPAPVVAAPPAPVVPPVAPTPPEVDQFWGASSEPHPMKLIAASANAHAVHGQVTAQAHRISDLRGSLLQWY
jgi:hypothetical protein